MSKKRSYIFAVFGFLIIFFIFCCACSSETDIRFDTDIENGSVYATEEFGEEFILPDVYVVNSSGEVVGEGTVKVSDPKGKEVETPYGILKLNKLGEYSVTVSYGKLDDLQYKIVCQDTIMPEITVINAPGSLEMGKTYSCVVFEYSDRAGINKSTLKYSFTYFDGTTETPVEYDEFTNEFTVDRYGWYIVRTEVEDINGNKSSVEKKMYVKNTSWIDDSLSEKMMATFDQEEYLSTFSESITQYWESINDESYLEEYKGESGVIKISCQYNSTLSGQATTRIRLSNPVHKDDVGDVKIRLRVEQDFESACMYFFQYNNTKDTPVYGHPDVTHPNNITIGTNEWLDLIISNNIFDNFADEEGIIRGFQIGTSRGYVNTSLNVDFYFADIMEMTRLSAPQNVRVSGTELSWDEAENATYYRIVLGDETITTEAISCDVGLYQGVISVIAATDDKAFYHSEAATILRIVPPDDYLAYYNSALYEGSAEIVANDVGITSAVTGQQILASYTDANDVTVQNVMKITVYSGYDVNGLNRSRATVKIKLPKSYTAAGYTLKYAIDYGGITTDYGFCNSDMTASTKWNLVNTDNTWTETYVDTNDAGDEVIMTFYVDSTGETFYVYLAWVKEGDARTIVVPAGYIAYYNDAWYEESAEIVPNATGIESAVTGQKVLASYTDANGTTVENVMRITVFSGYCETGLERARANVKVRLPKGYTAAGYTLKYAIDFAAMSTYGFFNPDMTASTTWDCENTDNTWQETYVDINNAGDEVIMTFYADSTRDTFYVYLAWVKEGDATH